MHEALAELRAYSARWGADAEIVQGAGGNTSFKHGRRLFVKASGMRLAEANRREIFVEVALDEAMAMVQGAATPAGQNGLRPSIETSLHAVMPHSFVAHVHAVEAIAFAVRADGASALAEHLSGLRWGWIPYLKPGAAVAQAVAQLLAQRPVDIIILGSHGIAIGGSNCAAVETLLTSVRERLASPVRRAGPDQAKLDELAGRFGLEPARFGEAHWAACEPTNLAYASCGTLYPDHVVFLGRGATVLAPTGPPPEAASLLYLAPGVGALLAAGAPDEAHEMAGCLGAVSARIAPGACVRPLSAAEESELLQWDAEAYRQELARKLKRAP